MFGEGMASYWNSSEVISPSSPAISQNVLANGESKIDSGLSDRQERGFELSCWYVLVVGVSLPGVVRVDGERGIGCSLIYSRLTSFASVGICVKYGNKRSS